MKQLILISFLFLVTNTFGQNTHLVYLKNKGSLDNQSSIMFSDRARERREKNNVNSDWSDIPVNSEYINQLSSIGKVVSSSRWLNAVRIESEFSPEELTKQFDFIDRIQTFSKTTNSSISADKLEVLVDKSLNYGWADTQVRQLNLPCVHDQGYLGSGVFLAVIDAGFNGMDTIPYFDSVYLENRIIDEFDFVGGGSVYSYSGHGTAVSSCIVGEMTGQNQYIGTAPDVDLALYVTEDVSSETQLEEYNLVLALERCDSIGVEVVNISLGYVGFDDTTTSYSYSSMDGQTTISAQGVTIAASKGIIVVTSAGNGGPGKIGTPCDADSILCVGAVDGFENYAFFSSIGPSFDGRVKPDVAARGAKPWVVWQNGDLIQSNGTSFSSPILAGATACLVQANPNKTAQEIIQAIRESGHQFANPDTLLGYGIPDFCSPFVGLLSLDADQLQLYPNPSENVFTISGLDSGKTSVLIYNQMGQLVEAKSFEKASEMIEYSHQLSNGVYSVLISNGENTFSKKLIVTK